MANLRSARGGGLQRDPEGSPENDMGVAPPDMNYPGGTDPTAPGSNRLSPIEMNPSQGGGPTPPQGAVPRVNAGPVGSAPLVSPPSPTAGATPFPIMPSPPPQSMVFPRSGGGNKLFGARGGQFGGGLTLGAETAQQGEQDPSDLIASLMQLLNGGQ